jgi:hypothetical protein
MDILAAAEYRKVAVVTNDGKLGALTDQLMSEGRQFMYHRTANKVVMDDTEFFFFPRNKLTTHLRGFMLDAAIVVGEFSEAENEERNCIQYALRLGDNPIRIHV